VIPFFVLVGAFILCTSRRVRKYRILAAWQHCLPLVVAAMFRLTASANRGKRRADLIHMVPPAFPRPEMLATLPGLIEIGGAIGMLCTPVNKAASLGLAFLLLALFPVNIYAAGHRLMMGGRKVPGLFVRTIPQAIFLAIVLAAGRS
jgi:uncharacterized membrane protein